MGCGGRIQGAAGAAVRPERVGGGVSAETQWSRGHRSVRPGPRWAGMAARGREGGGENFPPE